MTTNTGPVSKLQHCISLTKTVPHIIAQSKIYSERNEVSSSSIPPCLVCLPPLWKVETKIFFRVAGCVGSSQQTGIVVLVSSADRDSPDVCEINFPPSYLFISCKEVDFPLDVLPTAIGTEQEPNGKQKITK